MKTKTKIIRLFLEDKKPKTIRDISKRIKSDYKITHMAVKRLIEEEIIKTQTIGKSLLCNFNNSYFHIEIIKAEEERKEDIFKNKNIKQLYREIMSKIDDSFFVLLLFGSYAKNKQTKFSDIDLMFISNKNDFEDKISKIISLLPLKIHALVFTEEEFIRMKNAKKQNVVHEAIENNIILYNAELYYRLKNV